MRHGSDVQAVRLRSWFGAWLVALTACAEAELPQNPEALPYCCGGRGRCLPAAFLDPEQVALLGSEPCPETMVCVPDALVGGEPASCRVASTGAEGRCLPSCLPSIAARADQLERDGCAQRELCAPCYDPISGTGTGACDVGRRAAEPPTTFARCCEGVGRCVPSALLAEAQRDGLGRDACDEAALCVPETALTAGDGYVPEACVTAGFASEGRCLPACLPRLAGQLARLGQGGCAEHHVCAPCFDPLTGEGTGACELGGDPGPRERATVLERCCDGRALCVPGELVPERQRSQLGQNSCTSEGTLCVPEEIAQSADPASFVPSKCTVSALGSEGRCLSRCLPAVAAQPELFAQDGCAEGQACVPCADPRDGRVTGACAFGADPGAVAAPKLLASCCHGLGRCTPRAWIPAARAADLGPDRCEPGADLLCVAPAAALDDPDFVPARCSDPRTSAEGRCLPECLPAVTERASVLVRADCADENLCVPCFDPITGVASGACASGADPGPSSPPVVFEACCEGAEGSSGLCIPEALLPPGAPELPPQTCGGKDAVCAPRALVADPKAAFATCSSLLTSKGVCIETCYLPALAQTVSLAGSCGAGQLCVDCALLGESVGGCTPGP